MTPGKLRLVRISNVGGRRRDPAHITVQDRMLIALLDGPLTVEAMKVRVRGRITGRHVRGLVIDRWMRQEAGKAQRYTITQKGRTYAERIRRLLTAEVSP